jgi:predicted dienelactone hydrolase
MRTIVLGTLLALAAGATAKITPAGCDKAAGGATGDCLARYTKALAACTASDPASCHPASGMGPLDPITAAVEAPVRRACDDSTAIGLGWLGLDDVVLRTHDACGDFGDALFDLSTATPAPAKSSAAGRCQRVTSAELGKLRAKTIALFGRGCFLREERGGKCRRPARDHAAAALQAHAAKRIGGRCGADFAALGLGTVADAVGATFDRARHFAIFVYPPNDLGPTSDFGPYPVGVRTLDLADDSRLNPQGTGPRTVTTELWYPSTTEAVAGVDRYVVNLFGFDIAKTPTYRDVAHAPGPFPLVLFSHGNAGIRFQSIFLAAHLASHGYVVASPDHQGNTFIDILSGVIDPLDSEAINRPLDMKFLLDQLLAMNASDPFLAGTIDDTRVGMSGHSFGGYTTFALAAGAAADPRMKAFLPLAPAAVFDPTFFAGITAPILIMGGTLDVTTPFDANQATPFAHLPSGAPVVGLGEITGAGHFTFSDICEVPRNLVGAIGGFDEACTPAHLPWHDAHDIVNYLALNFFDATLRGDAAALARLDPAALASFDDLVYEAK